LAFAGSVFSAPASSLSILDSKGHWLDYKAATAENTSLLLTILWNYVKLLRLKLIWLQCNNLFGFIGQVRFPGNERNRNRFPRQRDKARLKIKIFLWKNSLSEKNQSFSFSGNVFSFFFLIWVDFWESAFFFSSLITDLKSWFRRIFLRLSFHNIDIPWNAIYYIIEWDIGSYVYSIKDKLIKAELLCTGSNAEEKETFKAMTARKNT
jgi:hypothetical protein